MFDLNWHLLTSENLLKKVHAASGFVPNHELEWLRGGQTRLEIITRLTESELVAFYTKRDEEAHLHAIAQRLADSAFNAGYRPGAPFYAKFEGNVQLNPPDVSAVLIFDPCLRGE